MTVVGVLVEVPVVNPARVPVTATRIASSTSAAPDVYVELVAPAIAVPLRVHWNENAVGWGVHVPGAAVSTCPTVLSPVIVGVLRVKVPAATGVEVTLSRIVTLPDRLALTSTVTYLPWSPAPSSYVADLAPVIASPLRRHWKLYVAGAGLQAPVAAVSVRPTCRVPLTLGVTVLVNAVFGFATTVMEAAAEYAAARVLVAGAYAR